MKELVKVCFAGAILGAALFGVAKSANAGDLFWTANQGNGAIVLTDSSADCGTALQYYATNGSQVIATGCWTYSDPFVIGTDGLGIQHRWLAAGFVATNYGRAKLARQGGM